MSGLLKVGAFPCVCVCGVPVCPLSLCPWGSALPGLVVQMMREEGMEPPSLRREYSGYFRSTMLDGKLIFGNNSLASYVRTNGHCPCPQSRVRAEGKVDRKQVH